MTIDRATFEDVLGPLQEIIDESARARDAAARQQQKQREQAGLSSANRSSFRLRRRICIQACSAPHALLHVIVTNGC